MFCHLNQVAQMIDQENPALGIFRLGLEGPTLPGDRLNQTAVGGFESSGFHVNQSRFVQRIPQSTVKIGRLGGVCA